MSEKPPKPKKSLESVSRRGALYLTGGLAAALATTNYLAKNPGSVENIKRFAHKLEGKRERVVEVDFKDTELAGKQCSGLAVSYFGFARSRPYPEKPITVDFQSNLEHMWAMKVARTKEDAPDNVDKIYDLSKKVTSEYEHGGSGSEVSNFTDAVTSFADTARNTLQGLDWNAIGKYYSIENTDTMDMLKYLASRAHGRSLMAFSMKEIMPGGNIADAIRTYDTLLRTAGPDFVASIPALGDSIPSFGQFQLTHHAIENGLGKKRRIWVGKDVTLHDKYDRPATHDDGKHVQASLIDMMSPATRIPDEIAKFRTFEQHTGGAVLLGLDAVAIAIKNLQHDWDETRIKRIAGMDGGTFASVLAAHHYKPSIARPALLEWSKDQNWPNKGPAHSEYYQFCAEKDEAVGRYAKRSFNNFQEVDGFFDLQGYGKAQ